MTHCSGRFEDVTAAGALHSYRGEQESPSQFAFDRAAGPYALPRRTPGLSTALFAIIDMTPNRVIAR
jgi:hypothetical protein